MSHRHVPLRRQGAQALGWLGACVLAFGALDTKAADALSFDQALRLAQERSRQITAQDAAAASARDLAVAAGQRPDPILKAGVNNLPINGEDRFSLTRDFMTMRSVSVMQELTRGSKLGARAARFEREADVAAARRAVALANLQRDAAAAWLDLHYQQRIRDVLVRQRDEARLQIDAADAAYRSGRGSQADAFAARAAVAQIEDRIAQADRQVTTARTMLARWIGTAADAQLGAMPPLDVMRLRPEDLAGPLPHHPEIAVLLKQEEIAQAEVEVARQNKKPDVSVELMYSQRGSAYSNMVSVNVSLPLQWDQANRQDRELGAKLAGVAQMRDQREEETRMHIAQALAMLAEWRSDRERLARYDDALLPLAGERTRASLAAYRGNTGPLTAVLEARRAEIDVRIERLRLEMEAARLWAQLTFLVPDGHAVTSGARP
jgi:outer membrane protein TolC